MWHIGSSGWCKGQNILGKIHHPNFRQLWKIHFACILSVTLAYGLCAFAQKWFLQFSNEHTNKGEFDSGLLLNTLTRQANDSDPVCIENWANDVKKLVPESNPTIIELVLSHLGLRESLSSRKHLAEYLQEPQPLEMLFNSSIGCISRIQGAAEIACSIWEASRWDLEDTSVRNYAIYSVHVGLVIEILTLQLRNDLLSFTEVTEVMQREQWQKFQDATDRRYQRGSELNQFLRDKYTGVAHAMRKLLESMATDQTLRLDAYLMINILEAFKVDIVRGNKGNARLGLALAVTTAYRMTAVKDSFEAKLGSDWIHAYLVWNFAYVYGLTDFTTVRITKLLIPSVVCSADENSGVDWMVNRVISLGLALMLQLEVPADEDLLATVNQEFDVGKLVDMGTSRPPSSEKLTMANRIGKINLQAAPLSSPSRELVENRLFELCGGFCHEKSWGVSNSVPFELMDDEAFRVFYSFYLWGSALFVGLSLEAFIWLLYLKHWCKRREKWWRFAQTLFSLLVPTAIGLALGHNFLALPLAVLGLFKLGFAEISMYFYVGLFDRHSHYIQRISDLLNGAGTLIHHSSILLAVCMALTGVLTGDRYIISATIPPMIQHWFTLLSLVDFWLYVAVELILEVFVQWTVIAYLEKFYDVHWSAALIGLVLLLSHWLMWLAGGLQLLTKKRSQISPPEFDNVITRGNLVYSEHFSQNSKATHRTDQDSDDRSFEHHGRCEQDGDDDSCECEEIKV